MIYAVFTLALLLTICMLGWRCITIEIQLRREDGLLIRRRPKAATVISLAPAGLMVGKFQPERLLIDNNCGSGRPPLAASTCE